MTNNEKFAAGLSRLNGTAGASQLRQALAGGQPAPRTRSSLDALRPSAPAPVQRTAEAVQPVVATEVAKQLAAKVKPEVQKVVREELTKQTLRQASRAEAPVTIGSSASQLRANLSVGAQSVSTELRDSLAPKSVADSGLVKQIVPETKVIPVTVAQRNSLLKKKLGVFDVPSGTLGERLGLPF